VTGRDSVPDLPGMLPRAQSGDAPPVPARAPRAASLDEVLKQQAPGGALTATPTTEAPSKPKRPVPELPKAYYLEKIKKAQAGGQDGFKRLSADAKTHALKELEKDIIAGLALNDTNRPLNRAEIAAIRVYTAADYMYMNPALTASANLQEGLAYYQKGFGTNTGNMEAYSWGNGIVGEDPMELHKTFSMEGLQHSAMAVQGMKKLKDVKMNLFRGERWEPAEYKRKYLDTKKVVRPAFTSLSTNPNKAKEFADSAAGDERGVLLNMAVKYGKRINELSVKNDPTGGEGEILLLPGSEFDIKSADLPDTKPKGPLNVELEQTK
jgi:hypothetical protein